MNELNKWLSLIANVSVIIGIIFLAIELNQNSVISKVDSVQSIQNINLLSLQNPDFAALHVKFFNNEQLNEIEQRQATDFTLYMISQSRMAYFQYENGLISEADLLDLLAPFEFCITNS